MQLLKDPLYLPSQQGGIPGYILCECSPAKLGMPCPIAIPSSPITISDDESSPNLGEDQPEPALSPTHLAFSDGLSYPTVQIT